MNRPTYMSGSVKGREGRRRNTSYLPLLPATVNVPLGKNRPLWAAFHLSHLMLLLSRQFYIWLGEIRGSAEITQTHFDCKNQSFKTETGTSSKAAWLFYHSCFMDCTVYFPCRKGEWNNINVRGVKRRAFTWFIASVTELKRYSCLVFTKYP